MLSIGSVNFPKSDQCCHKRETAAHRSCQRGRFASGIPITTGIVRVNAGHLGRIFCGPDISVFSAAAHAHKAGFLDNPCFAVRNSYRIPGFIRLQRLGGFDVGDAKTAPEQFHFSLRLMIPIDTRQDHGFSDAAASARRGCHAVALD